MANAMGCGTFILVGIAALIAIGDYHIGAGKEKEAVRRAGLSAPERAIEDAAASHEKLLSAARGACRIIIRRTLHDPDSADFEHSSSWGPTQENKDGSIRMMPHGRAKNAFGAYVYGVWDCTVRPEGDNMRVLSLEQVQP